MSTIGECILLKGFFRICSLKPSWLNDIDKKMHSGTVSLAWFHLGFNFNVGDSMTSSTDLFCKFNTFPFQAVESIRYNKISGGFPFKRKTTPMNKLRLKKCKLSKKTKKNITWNMFLRPIHLYLIFEKSSWKNQVR